MMPSVPHFQIGTSGTQLEDVEYPQLKWDPKIQQWRPEQPFVDNDVWLFCRRNPDYPQTASAGKDLDEYMRTHNIPKTLDGLEAAWTEVKSVWNSKAEEAQRHLEAVILKKLVAENSTQMLFDGMETEREA